jgi:signal transduction histidine kinase
LADTPIPAPSVPAWKRFIQFQDLVWVALFGSLIYAATDPHPLEIPLLVALCAMQVLEPKLTFFQTRAGVTTSVLLKVFFSYVLIGYTGGVGSSYYLLLLLPLVSASTTFGPIGAIGFTLVACGAYLSFLLLLDWNRYSLDPDQIQELIRRLTFFVIIGYLSNTLAASSRSQSERYRSVAEQLAAANRSLREAEAAMRRSERLAALGQLTAGLAHELRNPLGTIKASAEMLARDLPAGNDVSREVAGFISTEVDRTNLLVTRFLEFARPLNLRLASHELADLLDLAIQRVEQGVPPRNVVVYRNYSPDVPPVLLDADLMERVFYNLVLNAAQAAPPGGEITVKTRLVDSTVEVAVIDRGAGIAPADLENIFNPFFTTKPDGVGLGLAIVSKVIDEHGGKITVESELGKGSVFRVYLPLRAAPE